MHGIQEISFLVVTWTILRGHRHLAVHRQSGAELWTGAISRPSITPAFHRPYGPGSY